MRKVAVLVVLLVVIVGAVVFAVQGCRTSIPPMPPKAKAVFDVTDPKDAKQTTIDLALWETGLVVVPENGYRRDAKSGKVYADVVNCASCGKPIPEPPIKAGQNPMVAAAAYMCPICHKQASSVPAPPADR